VPMEPPPPGVAVVEGPHPTVSGGAATSAPALSKTGKSKKASATQVPRTPSCPPLALSAPASTPTTTIDGNMDIPQEVPDETSARFVSHL
jgi:hypothetical protein